MCFVDFKNRRRSTLSHDKLWVTVMDMGYPLHLIDLLAKLYRKQLAKAISSVIVTPVTMLFNRSLAEGSVPVVTESES